MKHLFQGRIAYSIAQLQNNLSSMQVEECTMNVLPYAEEVREKLSVDYLKTSAGRLIIREALALLLNLAIQWFV